MKQQVVHICVYGITRGEVQKVMMASGEIIRELHLRNDELTSSLETVGELRKLRPVDLRGNPLTHLPAALATLPRLEKLDIDRTKEESYSQGIHPDTP